MITANTRAGFWLISDMCLNIAALSLVKAIGADYPTLQIVFFRAVTGMLLLLPWCFLSYNSFFKVKNLPLHAARIGCSVLALGCGYYAVARVPLALFSAVNYLRPAVLMLLATLVFGEWISKRQWSAVALGFIGVLVAVRPDNVSPGAGLTALFFAVIAGSAATVILRRLKGTPEIVTMAFYTGGIALLTAPFAITQWVPLNTQDTLSLVTIGLLAQSAQYCFLQAHWTGDVGFLGPLGYSSLILSAIAGFLFFEEIPSISLALGAGIILLSAILLRNFR